MDHFGSYWTEFHEIWYFSISENLPGKVKFHYCLTRIIGTLHAEWYTLCILSRSIHLRMKNVSDKSCREKQNIFKNQAV
jgi:hypothetical protein